MLAKVHSAAVLGIDAYPIEVEVNAGWGQPAAIIVGLPDAAVKESRDRVKTAIENSGFKYVMGRTTINLAPADVHSGRKGPLRGLKAPHRLIIQYKSRFASRMPTKMARLRLGNSL